MTSISLASLTEKYITGRNSSELRPNISWKNALEIIDNYSHSALDRKYDIAKRVVIVTLQYWQIYKEYDIKPMRTNMENIESSFDNSVLSMYDYYKREIIVDICTLIYNSRFVGLEQNRFNIRGMGTKHSNSAKVLELLIMRAHRHCIKLRAISICLVPVNLMNTNLWDSTIIDTTIRERIYEIEDKNKHQMDSISRFMKNNYFEIIGLAPACNLNEVKDAIYSHGCVRRCLLDKAETTITICCEIVGSEISFMNIIDVVQLAFN